MTLAELNERFSNAAQAKNTLKEPDSINLKDYLVGYQSQYMETMTINKFPKTKTKTLTGNKLVFPDFLKGKKALIAVVFEEKGKYMKPQLQANKWKQFWQQELQMAGVTFYEIPAMSGRYVLMSPLVDNWMRGGIDEQFHDNVASFYGNKKRLAEDLRVDDLSNCYMALIDEQGNIITSAVGEISEEKKQQFVAVIN